MTRLEFLGPQPLSLPKLRVVLVIMTATTNTNPQVAFTARAHSLHLQLTSTV